MNYLPFFSDDTKTARFPDEIAQTVYAFADGQSRGRGTVEGLAQQFEFQSVLISSGEQPLIGIGQHGGVRARVLTVWGSPFGTTDEETCRVVREFNRGLSLNYGHAGPMFIEYLLARRNRWGQYLKKHTEWNAYFADRAGNNPVAGRMAAHLAAIAVTSLSVHKALDLPWPWSDPITPLYDELTKELVEADRGAAGMRCAMEWAVAHQNDSFQNASRRYLLQFR